MLAYFDRVKFSTSTTGTGSVTVGTAASGCQLPAAAGMLDGQWTYYAIEDGTAWETGKCYASSTATVLSRTLTDSSTGSLLSLSGSANMYFTPVSDTMGQIPLIGAMLAIAVGMVSL